MDGNNSTYVQPDAPKYYDWHPANKDITVHLKLSVVDSIRHVAFDSNPDNRERGGLLVGRMEDSPSGPRSVWVEDFLPIQLDHLLAGTAVLPTTPLAEATDGGTIIRKDLRVVGFYRTHARSGVYLDERDVALMQTHFSQPCNVALVVRHARFGIDQAGFFFWEGHHLDGDQTALQFPFRVEDLAAPRKVEVNKRASGSLRSRIAPYAEMFRPAARASSWLWLPFLTAALVLLPLAFYQARRDSGSAHKTELNMTAERTNGGVRLIWNRNSPIVREAQGASLWITDGDATKRVDLDAAQVSGGSVVYWPNTRDLNFRLQVFAPGRSATETLRTLAGADAVQQAQAQVSPAAVSQSPAPASAQPPAEWTQTGNSDSLRQKTQQVLAQSNRSRARRLPGEEDDADEDDRSAQAAPPQQQQTVAATPAASTPTPQQQAAAPVPVQAAKPSALAPVIPAHTYNAHEPSVIAQVSYEPEDESGFRKAVSKMPLLKHLQRGYKGGQEFTPAKATKQVTPPLPIMLRKQIGSDDIYIDVRAEVGKDGAVKKVEGPSSKRHAELVQLASDTAKKWKFAPARFRDKQTDSNVIMHFHFGPVREAANR